VEHRRKIYRQPSRQFDILDMLNEKTKGNLDKNESSLIQGVLYELKMRYVKEKV